MVYNRNDRKVLHTNAEEQKMDYYFDKFSFAEIDGLGIVFETLRNVHFFTERNINMHTHMVFELYVLQEGEAEIATENGIYRLTSGEVALISPKVYHNITNISERFHLISLSFQLYKISRLQNAEEKQMNDILDMLLHSHVLLLQKQPKIARAFEMLLEARNEQALANTYLINAYAMEILVYLVRALPPALESSAAIPGRSGRQTKSIELERMSIIEGYLYEHYADGNIADLAKLLLLSEQHVRRFLRQNYGMSFSGLLNKQRINISKSLLLHSDKSISEIWEAVGFGSAQNFAIAFRKYTALSPTEYRKQHMHAGISEGRT